MADPGETDDKYDHSDHPLERPKVDDLRAPGGGKREPHEGDRDSRGGVNQKEPVVPPDSVNRRS